MAQETDMEIFTDQTRKEHFLSRTDARVKIISSLMILVMVLSYRGIFFPLFVFVAGMGLCYKMKIPLKRFLLRFSEPLFIVSVVLILKLFFSGKETLFSFAWFGITVIGHSDGLMEGIRIACRIMGAVSIVAVLGFSTPFNEIMAGLSWMRVPRSFVEISMFAYRYIFLLFEDGMVIYNAQKNRLGYTKIRRGLNSFGVLAGSLTLKAFDNSHNTTVAMVQRGYDGTMPLLKQKPFRLAEVSLSILVIAVMGIIWTR